MSRTVSKWLLAGVLAGILLAPNGASAGNKWMMEKMAREVTAENNAVIRKLNLAGRNGKVTLAADVAYRHNDIEIKLQRLNFTSAR